ncbi:TRAP transporter small permease [Thermodesulfobacteriota bacterium]
MNRFADIVGRIIVLGTALGAVFLAIIMVLIVTSIVTRFFGRVVPGSYELIELMIVVTVAFALAYTGLKQGHVTVNILVSRFPQRVQDIVASFTCLISLGLWGVMAWVAYKIAVEKGILEVTDYFLVPYIPFRFVFALGLFLLTLVFFIDMYKSIKQGLNR